MAATMFSFLDQSLYGDGRRQAQPGTGSAPTQIPVTAAMPRPSPSDSAETMQPAQPQAEPARQGGAPQPAVAAPPCLSERELKQAMGNLQARLASAEKRTQMMEQRLLSALDERDARPPPAQSGCSWPLFVFVVFVFVGVLLFTSRGARPALAPPSFPLMLPGSLPGSPVVLPLSGGAAPPATFLRGG
jgi:hypothetical protein